MKPLMSGSAMSVAARCRMAFMICPSGLPSSQRTRSLRETLRQKGSISESTAQTQRPKPPPARHTAAMRIAWKMSCRMAFCRPVSVARKLTGQGASHIMHAAGVPVPWRELRASCLHLSEQSSGSWHCCSGVPSPSPSMSGSACTSVRG